MSIKISNFAPLNTPAGNDIIPIIDVSEPNTADQNKKITVDNLLSLAGAGGNPYLQTDLTGTFSSNVNTSGIILGENNNIISNEAENSLIFGNNNSLEVSGDFQQGDNNYILGSFNTNKDNSKQTFIVGYLNILGGDSDYSILIGSESFLGFRTDGYTGTSFDSKQSFVAGYKNTSLGFSNTCVGNNNILYEGTQTSVVIGSNIIVNSDVGIGNSPNIIEGVIAIGDEATATDDYSVALGFNTEAGGRYSTCLGPYSTVEAGANDAISIGGSYISSTAEESISIGLFSYTNGPASIAIGPRSSANPTTARAISIGDGSAARAANSIVIGGNNGVNNTCTNSISIGDESGIFLGGIDAIVLGSNNNINNNCQGSISIGKGNTIFVNSPNCIALGYNANVATALTNSIQLGTGTVTTPNTLQFGSTKLANSNLGLIIKTNTTAPAVTLNDAGTLGLNAGTPQYVNSSGTWTNLTTKFAPYSLSRSAGEENQTLSINGTTTLLHDTFGQLTAAGYINAPITYTSASGTITFSQIGVYRIFGSFTVASATASQAFFININTVSGTVNYNSNNFYTTSATANALSYINAEFLISVTTLGAQIQLQALTSGNASTITLYSQSSSPSTTNKFSITMI